MDIEPADIDDLPRNDVVRFLLRKCVMQIADYRGAGKPLTGQLH
jgi:hypothetical protein